MAYRSEFTITNKLLNSIIQCEIAREIIDNSPIIPSWERKFQNDAVVRTVHHSTAIEGNALTYSDAEQIVKKGKLENIRVRDVREIVNYREVIGKLSAFQNQMFTMGLICSIQNDLGTNILPEKYLGNFRSTKAVILNSQTNEVVFDPPAPDEIEDEINVLMAWLNDSAKDLNPLLEAGIAHYEFVRIHPFVDLNGRTARILTTLVLYKRGFEINKFFSLEEYYDQDLPSYYSALDSANDGDLTAWLEYFVAGVANELTIVKDKIIRVSKERNLRTKVGQISLNERQLAIIDYIEKNGSIINPDFTILFPKVSDDTILRDLTALIQKKIIIKKGKTKAAQYFLL